MSIKYNEFGEVISVNGIITGHHLGTPMQDATPDKPEDNELYATERNTVTRIPNSEETWENQPTPPGSSGCGASIETCTVTIAEIYSDENDVKIHYMALENGEVKAKSVEGKSCNLTDVVKGSLMMITTNGTNYVAYTVLEGDVEVLWKMNRYYPAACVLINSDCYFNANPD